MCREYDEKLLAAKGTKDSQRTRSRALGSAQTPLSLAGEGENLWSGTAGYFAPEAMVGAFIAERRYFKAGVFPNVSTTGKWTDVGHYSQVIWPTTTELGCALAHNKARDYLVCRYSPPGNHFGRPVG